MTTTGSTRTGTTGPATSTSIEVCASISSWRRSPLPKPPPSPSSTASPARASSPPTTPRCSSTTTSDSSRAESGQLAWLGQAGAELGQAGAEHVAQLGAREAHLGVELLHRTGRLSFESVVGGDHL